MALEQSALSDILPSDKRTVTFAYYNFLGSCTSASGSLLAGFTTSTLVDKQGLSRIDSYRIIFLQYGFWAAVLIVLASALSIRIESKAWAERHSEALRKGQPEESGKEEEDSEPLLKDGAGEDGVWRRCGEGVERHMKSFTLLIYSPHLVNPPLITHPHTYISTL